MADIPDEFLEGWKEGFFPTRSAREWLDDNPDEAREVRQYMDAGASMDWAMGLADVGAPMPSEWDSVTIHRDMSGDYDVIIHAEGETYSLNAATNDEIASDNIWGDFWYDFLLEYDIDVERDFEGYSENPS